MALPALAQSFESGGIYYYLQSDYDANGNYIGNSACVASSPEDNKYSGDIVIPSSVEYDGQTYSVTSIGNSAFSYCQSLKSVVIPESVTKIPSWAFQNCTSLTSVDIPESVKTIEACAFYNCASLTSVKIPSTQTKIENDTFTGCSSLTSIEIPSSVTKIGDYAFQGCSSLTSIIIPSSVTSVGTNAFSNCTSLTSVEIPNSVTSIGSSAFSYCTSLTSVEIPNSVTSIGDSAFYNCTSLTSVEIPNSVTSVGTYAFSNCTSLTSIEMPSTMISIEGGTFASCTSLKSIVIPSSVSSIGDCAFSQCTSLTSVEIPNSVTKIESGAFQGCSSLISINIPQSVTEIVGSTFSGCSSLTSVEIPNSVKSIESYAFGNCNLRVFIIKSKDVTFAQNIFGEWGNKPYYVFAPYGLDCSALNIVDVWGNDMVKYFDPETTTFLADGTVLTENGKTLFFVPQITGEDCMTGTGGNYVIPDGVTKIAKDAFSANSSLKELTIPASVVEIEADAFSNTACERVNFIDWNAWYSNVKLGNLYSNPYWNSKPYVGGVVMTTPELKEGMTEIPDYVNYGLQYKDEIELPTTIKRVGAYAFYNNKELYYVGLPAGLEEIGESAFEGCALLENPAFPTGLKKIEDGAYAGCTKLTEIVLPEGLTMLGEMKPVETVIDAWGNVMPVLKKGVFEGCSALEKAVLVADIDYLDDNLFKGCTALDKVYFPLQLKKIGDSAFEKCLTLDEITLPATLESIGARAFIGDDREPWNTWDSSLYGHISKLTIPNSVKTIGREAFAYQSIANLSIGNGVETISEKAFYSNPSLKVISFSEGLKEIGAEAFSHYGQYDYNDNNKYQYYRRSYISSVILPSTVTTIGEGAFGGCYISELSIPDQVMALGVRSCGSPSVLTLGSGIKEIASDAFDFEKLYTIRLKAHMPPTLSDAFPLTQEQNDNLTLIVNEGRHDHYNTNARWKQIDNIIEEGQSDVIIYMTGDYAISEEIRVTTGLMPSSVTKMKVVGPLTAQDLRIIKENMIALTSLDMSEVNNVTALPENQFANSLLTDIILPLNLESIGNYAFNSCSLLEIDELPETIKTIGYGAFSNSPRVNITKLPAALETLEGEAFQGTGLRSITTGENLKEIGYNAFSNCTLLETADLSASSITAVPGYAFAGCYELDEVVLPESVTSIGENAFNGTALRNIDFASGVSEIGYGAFSGNRRLVAATLPASVKQVSSDIFSNCPRLIAVSMPSVTASVGTNILNGDRKLANLSCAAVEAPDAEAGAFDGLRFRYVALTVPTLSYRSYLNAPQWGKFQNIKNRIPVEIDKGVEVSNVSEAEYQDMLTEDALEEAQEAAAQENGEISRTRAERRAVARAKSAQSFASLFDGAQIQTSDESSAPRVFIFPEDGVKVISILFEGEELLPSYDGHSVLLPKGSNGTLQIRTDYVEKDPVEGAVDAVVSEELNVVIEGSDIVVVGVAAGTQVGVFGLDGKAYFNGVSNGSDLRVSVAPGVYVLKAGNAVKKVMIR